MIRGPKFENLRIIINKIMPCLALISRAMPFLGLRKRQEVYVTLVRLLVSFISKPLTVSLSSTHHLSPSSPSCCVWISFLLGKKSPSSSLHCFPEFSHWTEFSHRVLPPPTPSLRTGEVEGFVSCASIWGTVRNSSEKPMKREMRKKTHSEERKGGGIPGWAAATT